MNRLIITETDRKNLERLNVLFRQHPKHYVKMLNNPNGKYVDLTRWLIEKTPNLPPGYSMSTRCRWIVDGRTEFPVCPTCGKTYGVGKDVKFAKGYDMHCSVKCSENDKTVMDKIRKTNLERYGVDCPLKSEEIKEKIRETNLERYGVDYVLKNEEVKKKIRETNLERYGVEYTSQVKEFTERARETYYKTSMQRYGVRSPTQTKEVREKMSKALKETYADHGDEINRKIKDTSISRYGVDHHLKSEVVRKKIRETNLERYGVECIFESEEIRQKLKETNLKKYGVEFPIKSQQYRDLMKKRMIAKYGVDCSFRLPSVRERSSKTNIERYGCPHGRSLRYMYDGISFDSSWEVAFWIWNKDHGIKITRPKTSFEYCVQGKTRRYFPDFEIDGVFYELKGDQFFDDNGVMRNPYDATQNEVYAAKQDCMKQHRVVVLRKTNIVQYLQYVQETYGENLFESVRVNH